MNEERYKQIKDSIELQSLVKAQIGVEDELLQEEIELLKAYEKLQQENQELKKQFDEYKDLHYCSFIDICKSTKIANYNQQKEFIKYLEDEIKTTKIKYGNKLTEKGYIDIAITVRAYQYILQKYKSIIGVSDETN